MDQFCLLPLLAQTVLNHTVFPFMLSSPLALSTGVKSSSLINFTRFGHHLSGGSIDMWITIILAPFIPKVPLHRRCFLLGYDSSFSSGCVVPQLTVGKEGSSKNVSCIGALACSEDRPCSGVDGSNLCGHGTGWGMLAAASTLPESENHAFLLVQDWKWMGHFRDWEEAKCQANWILVAGSLSH